MSTFYPLHRYKNVREAYDASLAVPPVDAFIRLNNRERLNPLSLLIQPTLTVTPLTLVGRLTPGWGEAFNENFLHLLENFADTRPPPSPISGQLWYQDTPGSPSMRFYSGELGTIWHDLVHSVQGRVQMGTVSLLGAGGDDPQIRLGATAQDDRIEFERASDALVVYLNSAEEFRIQPTGATAGVRIPSGRDFYRGTMGLGARIDAIGSLVASVNVNGNSTFNGNLVINPPASIFSDRYFFTSDPTTGMRFNTPNSGTIIFQARGSLTPHTINADGSEWIRGSGAGVLISRAAADGNGNRGFIAFGSNEASPTGLMGLSHVTGTMNGLMLWGTGVTNIATTGGLTVDHGATVSGALAANGGLTTTNATVSGALAANGGLTTTNATVSGALAANGGLTTTNATVSGALAANGGLTTTNATVNGDLAANGNVVVRSGAPTVFFRDTNANSAAWQANDGMMFLLRGGNDTTAMATAVQDWWPLRINLNDYDAFFGGNITARLDITSLSDAKFKDDVETITDGLTLVSMLRGVRYTDNRDGKCRVGFIAQEVRSVLPNLVLADENGTLSVAYHRVTAVLVEACKTLKLRAETAEAKLAEMEARLAAIETRLASL